jgi:DNA-binding transcriptional LysR family regulator
LDHDSYSDDYLRGILERVRTIAVVGASTRRERPSHGVMAYLQRHGEPQEPEALMEHDALRLLRNGAPAPWVLIRGNQRWEGIPPGRAAANSPELLLRLARSGAGITSVGDHFAEPYVRTGELVPDRTNTHARCAGRDNSDRFQ